MVDVAALSNAVAVVWRDLPLLVAELSGPESIAAFVDRNPSANSLALAIYQMAAGSILVAWQETTIVAGDMEAWEHRFQAFVRAKKDRSALNAIHALMEGVPTSGEGLRWRYCPVMAGTLPPEVPEISRLTDEEGIDYFAVTVLIKETGD